MTTREEIIRALGQLDPATFEDVINTAYRTRYDSIEAAGQTSPDPREGPATFGRWLARRHMSSDAAIDRVVYLPTGAPKEEIRLVEVNRLLNSPNEDAIEPPTSRPTWPTSLSGCLPPTSPRTDGSRFNGKEASRCLPAGNWKGTRSF